MSYGNSAADIGVHGSNVKNAPDQMTTRTRLTTPVKVS